MANYLREPYSADLDFGTGEWSASAWVNVPVTLPDASFPLSAERITNGTFDTDTAWSKGSGWTISGGQAQVTSAATNLDLIQNFGAVQGSRYRVSFDYTVSGAQASVWIGAGNAPQINFAAGTSGTYNSVITANSGNEFLIRAYAGATVTIDNVSIKELTPAPIVDRAHSSGPRIQLGLAASGRLTAIAYDGITTRTVTSPAAYNTATWTKAEACYTTDGTLSIRVNGQQVAATYGTPLLTLNNSNAVLTIGNSYNLDAPFPGSLALLKLSATVPTAEQSLWMYEQEKQMFREGAQVTLPDSNAINDLTYDEVTDKWIAVSSTNMSEWSGLVRTNVTAVPSGSYSKLASAGGVTLQGRGSNVDITIPSYGLRKELVKRAEATAKQARTLVPFDYVGGFTANTTNGATSITSVASLTYPTSYIGAQITGTGIQAGTVIAAVNGSTIYISKPATATGTAVQISFTDFILPMGYEAKDVLLAGVSQKEGSTAAFTRLFDGFKETIRFTTAPNYAALVQIKAARSIQ